MLQRFVYNNKANAGSAALVVACTCGALLFTSCEDDPIVEPKGGTKTGGSYGGRLALPDTANSATTVPFLAPAANPELF